MNNMQLCFLVPLEVFVKGCLPQSHHCAMYVHTRVHTETVMLHVRWILK